MSYCRRSPLVRRIAPVGRTRGEVREEFTSCRVVDLPSAVQKITQRDTMLDAVDQVKHAFDLGGAVDDEGKPSGPSVARRGNRVRAGNGGGG